MFVIPFYTALERVESLYFSGYGMFEAQSFSSKNEKSKIEHEAVDSFIVPIYLPVFCDVSIVAAKCISSNMSVGAFTSHKLVMF